MATNEPRESRGAETGHNHGAHEGHAHHEEEHHAHGAHAEHDHDEHGTPVTPTAPMRATLTTTMPTT